MTSSSPSPSPFPSAIPSLSSLLPPENIRFSFPKHSDPSNVSSILHYKLYSNSIKKENLSPPSPLPLSLSDLNQKVFSAMWKKFSPFGPLKFLSVNPSPTTSNPTLTSISSTSSPVTSSSSPSTSSTLPLPSPSLLHPKSKSKPLTAFSGFVGFSSSLQSARVLSTFNKKIIYLHGEEEEGEAVKGEVKNDANDNENFTLEMNYAVVREQNGEGEDDTEVEGDGGESSGKGGNASNAKEKEISTSPPSLPGISIISPIFPPSLFPYFTHLISVPPLSSSKYSFEIGSPRREEDGRMGFPLPKQMTEEMKFLLNPFDTKDNNINITENKGENKEKGDETQSSSSSSPLSSFHPSPKLPFIHDKFSSSSTVIMSPSGMVFPFPLSPSPPSHSSSSVPFNRLSLQMLQPGQGCNVIDVGVEGHPQQQGDFSLIALGGGIIVEIYDKQCKRKGKGKGKKEKDSSSSLEGNEKEVKEDENDDYHDHITPSSIVSLFLPPNSSLHMTPLATSRFTISIPQRSRDNIGESSRPKRTPTLLIWGRKIENVGEEEWKEWTEKQQNGKKGKGQGKGKGKEKGVKSPSDTDNADSSDLDDRKLVAFPVPPNFSPTLETLHVHTVYNAIASHFSHTRHTPWPKIDQFIRNIPKGKKVIDVGCGNGKYLGVNKDIEIYGVDISSELVKICHEKGYPNVVVGDTTAIPYADNHFHYALSIAVLHHLSTPSRRLLAIRELLRVVQSNGVILISAWALEQDATSRRVFPQQDVFVPWNVPQRFVDKDKMKEVEGEIRKIKGQEEKEKGKDHGDPKEEDSDSTVPVMGIPTSAMNNDKIVVHRYCHVYIEGELEGLLKEVGGNEIVESYFDRGNWVVAARKL